MKSIRKTNISFNFYDLPASKGKHDYIKIKTTHPILLTFFSNFLSFDSCVLIFFVLYFA